MAKHNNTLQLIACKLGLGDEDKVLSKAAEFERLLQMKSTCNSNISDTSRVVICLDLAASFCGRDVDLKTAVKYSGLRSSLYTNNRKIIENLLELNNDTLTTLTLCLPLQSSGIQELADSILDGYQQKTKMKVDLDLPQYVCMAVYQACRLNKVKMPKSKLIEKSRLKAAQWSKLDMEWTKFVDENFVAVKKKKGRSTTNTIAGVREEIEEKMAVDTTNKEEHNETPAESYRDWKQRILELAYKELKKQNKQENKDKKDIQTVGIENKQNTPRRSPRKTPQKYEPYKSPIKSKGVRLLFQVN